MRIGDGDFDDEDDKGVISSRESGSRKGGIMEEFLREKEFVVDQRKVCRCGDKSGRRGQAGVAHRNVPPGLAVSCHVGSHQPEIAGRISERQC